MRPLRTTVMCMVLAGAAATPAAPQYGLGLGRGFTGLGLRNWALYESGADSIAAWYRLTDEQRGQVEELVGQFRRENADAVARWKQMQGDIQSLMTGNVQPGWAAIYAVGEKYGHPGQELQPALYQLHLRLTALLTPLQGQLYSPRAYWGMGRGRGFAGRRFGGGYRSLRGPSFNRWPGWLPPED